MNGARAAMLPRTTVEAGRLPAPAMGAPICAENFARLAGAWGRCGVWLTLWSPDGQCICRAENASRFWTQLWTHGKALRNGLSKAVRDAVEKTNTYTTGDCDGVGLSLWEPDLRIILAPVRADRRSIGCVVGCSIGSSGFGESLVRLCDHCALDVPAMRQWAAEAAGRDGALAEGTAHLLSLTVDLSRQLESARNDVAALTKNLDETYEELHLIYKISGKMSISDRPARVLALIGREMLEVCRASGFAFVLKEAESHRDPANIHSVCAADSQSDRIVQIGNGAPSLADLDRLAESLLLQNESPVEHLLINEAPRRTELRWASSWLRHLVALPLWHDRHLLGVMLAINCIDDGDFTSVDVQLFRGIADRIAPFLQNRRLYDDLTDLLMGMLHALVNSIDAKDTYTCGHSERVAFFARALAQAAGLPAQTCERIYLSGLLHDVGKIGVPDAILCKTGKLTNEEFDAMRRHPEIGARILEDVRQIQDLLPGVLHHHERMDGRGYPAGLAAQDIPIFGRIICIADCFDAMTTNRTYRSALPLPVAIAEVRRCAGTQFDPHLTEIFLKLDHSRLFAEARMISSATDILSATRCRRGVQGAA